MKTQKTPYRNGKATLYEATEGDWRYTLTVRYVPKGELQGRRVDARCEKLKPNGTVKTRSRGLNFHSLPSHARDALSTLITDEDWVLIDADGSPDNPPTDNGPYWFERHIYGDMFDQ